MKKNNQSTACQKRVDQVFEEEEKLKELELSSDRINNMAKKVAYRNKQIIDRLTKEWVLLGGRYLASDTPIK